MLDLKFIRENPDIVKNACTVKNFPDVVDDILKLDVRVRELKTCSGQSWPARICLCCPG